MSEAYEVKDFRHLDKWYGTYRGVSFEISGHTLKDFDGCDRQVFAYYIYIDSRMLPPERLEAIDIKPRKNEYGRTIHDYHETWFANLEFHGGMTWCSPEMNLGDHEAKLFKVGCDYDHSWDQDHFYDEKYVLADVRITIDDLWDKIPNLKIRNWRTGVFE